MVPEIQYAASQRVHDAITSLGRTEDVRFSPNNQRLAIAAFSLNQIAIFDVAISASAGGVRVALAGGVQIASSVLNEPHGVDFLDDDTVIVASRGGGNVATFRLPAGSAEFHSTDAAPFEIWPAEPSTLVKEPSTVSVTCRERGMSEILICDHAEHIVTRHVVDSNARGAVKRDVLLQKLLMLPDGVAISADRHWIAVSNHSTHTVLMYENSTKLSADTDPAGILRRVYAPHGLRFSADGQQLLVADADAPHILVYACERNDWSGIRNPRAAVTIMDDETFRRGHLGPGDGGPKGLDIDAGSHVVAVTSRCQPLAFFDLSAVLQHSTATKDTGELGAEDFTFERRLMDELAETQRERTAQAESHARVHYMINSRSWRITAPLRRLDGLLRSRF
jgi:DNA-binding beta-propeller fold protein YncE